jgi:hypothetical protein
LTMACTPTSARRILRRSEQCRGRRFGMQEIVGFDQLDRHQKALAGVARDARVSAQLKIRTTTWFDQGQSHPLAAFQARNLGGLKMCTGWGWHHARSVVGGSAIVLLTDGSRDRAAIDQSYTFTRRRTPSNSRHARKQNQKARTSPGSLPIAQSHRKFS